MGQGMKGNCDKRMQKQFSNEPPVNLPLACPRELVNHCPQIACSLSSHPSNVYPWSGKALPPHFPVVGACSVPGYGFQRNATRCGQFLHVGRLELEAWIKDANMYPWSVRSLGFLFGINLSNLLNSLVQSLIKYS